MRRLLLTAIVLPLIASPAYADERPTAIVAMGDSTISGEAAGDYTLDSNRKGNFCHRSIAAEIMQTNADVDEKINIACSGAKTSNVGIVGQSRFDERPQVEQLYALGRTYRITMVLLGIGANDVNWGDVILDCAKAYIGVSDDCRDGWAARVPTLIANAAPRVASNIDDIKRALRAVGSPDAQVVLQSYASPITPTMRFGPKDTGKNGCPFHPLDAGWIREAVVPQFREMYADVARATDVRYLDVSNAMRGREVCAAGITREQEWQTGLAFNPASTPGGLSVHMFQETLHPNARGHAALAGCLSRFLPMWRRAASCELDNEGKLQPRDLIDQPVDPAATN